MRPLSPRLRTGLAVAGLTLWPFVYFWRATLGRVALLPHDGYRLIYPSKLLAARALSEGSLLLWTPYAFSGFPFFAAMQPGVLHPGIWLFCVLPPIAAANLQMILNASLTAIGTYGFTRQIGCTRLAAVYAGVTFALGGFMVAHVGHYQMPQGMAVLPWLLWAFDVLRTRMRLRIVIGAAAALTMALFAGYAPGLFYVLALCGAYVAAALRAGPATGRLRYGLACAAVVAAGVLLAAVQLVPMFELVRDSIRTRIEFYYFVAFSLPPAQLPMLLFPFLFGGHDPTPYWGKWNFTELTGYVGIAPWMLALAAAPLWRRSRQVRFWLVVAIAALLMAVGDATPLAEMLYRVPVYSLLRGQARNLYFLDFALAVLAAQALSCASRRALIAGAVSIAVLAIGIAALALSAGESLWLAQAIESLGEAGRVPVAALSASNRSIWLPVVIALASGGALIALALRRSAARYALVLALQLADLWYFGSVLDRQNPRPNWVLHPTAVMQAAADLPIDVAAARVAVVSNSSEALDLRPTLAGVPLVNGYDSLPLVRYTKLAGDMQYWGQIYPLMAFAHPVFLDLLNARWVIVLHPPHAPPAGADIDRALADGARWSLRARTPEYTVLENQLVRPRAWLVERTVALDPEATHAAVYDGRFADGTPFDVARVAIVQGVAARQYGEHAATDTATVATYRPHELEIVTRAGGPAFLVVSEVDYPGWHAYVDGAEVPIVRTDYSLRGVELGPGEHHVRMVFAPRSLRVGLAVSAATALALVVAGVVRWRWRLRSCSCS